MAVNLGTAYIRIAPDLTGVQNKLSRELNKGISAAGEKAGASFGGSFAKFANDPIVSFGDRVLKGTLVAGAVAAGALIAKNLGGAISRSDIMANFPKVMGNMGISADTAAVVIKELSASLRGLPTRLDDATLSVQRLTTKTGDVRQAKDIFLALNNAIIAGGAPMELQSTAMEQFSQAFAKGKPDMVEWRSILSAMPAQLQQVAKEMNIPSVDKLGEKLRNGDITMQQFSDSLIRLNSKGVGGLPTLAEQAKNASGGIQTNIANMNAAIQRGLQKLIEQIGRDNIANAIVGIGKAFETALGYVGNFINFVKDNKDFMVPIIVAIGTFMTIAASLAVIMKVVAVATALWNAALLANPIVLVIALVASLVAGLIYFFTQTETGRKVFETAMGAIKAAAGATVSFVINTFNSITGFFTALWDGIKGIFNGFIDFVRNNWAVILLVVMTGGVALILAMIIRNWDSIVAFTQNMVNRIVGIFQSLPGIITSVFSSAKNNVIGIWSGIPGFFSGVVSNIGNTFQNVISYVRNAFNSAVSAIKSIDWSGIGMDIIRGIGNGIAGMGGWLAQKAKDAVGGAKDQLKSFLGIHSPSRVMEKEIGVMMGRGMANGIAKTAGLVAKSSRNLADASLSSFNSAPAMKFSAAEDYSVSHLKQPAIINIQVGSKQIAQQMIDDINDISFLNGTSMLTV